MFALLTAALAFSGSHFTPARSSAVTMSAASDVKKGLATLGVLASVTLMPMASDAVASFDLPSTSVAAKAFNPPVKKVDLGDEDNKLKRGFKGLGLTTGFRAKKPPASQFKAPPSAKIFKGSFSVSPK
ncbi:hypothetical protein KFE25_007093 [Diacronema lutheri]|uniref:Uncharacterized protein n=2 Tax=Diacronema lutheri TaxID=2081491 RepID=A0A8J5XFT4_DIALT|nr:hypothetical protein KFE25_007093 [Diacronema lutheri]